jgi:hypothetical protein
LARSAPFSIAMCRRENRIANCTSTGNLGIIPAGRWFVVGGTKQRRHKVVAQAR